MMQTIIAYSKIAVVRPHGSVNALNALDFQRQMTSAFLLSIEQRQSHWWPCSDKGEATAKDLTQGNANEKVSTPVRFAGKDALITLETNIRLIEEFLPDLLWKQEDVAKAFR